MRILLLNYEFPPVGGGAATASAQIARHLARRGVQVVVLTSQFRGLPRREPRDGYLVYRVPAGRRHIDRCSVPEMGAYMLGAAAPALRLARAFRPDLMHVYFGMPTGPVGLLVNQVLGVPYLLSLRGGDVPGFMADELARMHQLTMPLTRRIWHRAGALVANSPRLHELATRVVPDRTVELVPNGVDLELFRPPETASRPEGAPVRLLFVGRLVRQKGLVYLLQSLGRLDPAIRAGVELELVGSGPDEASLRALAAALGIAAQVRFAGWVAREAIVAHYQQADVFVLPSLDEGMPNVVLEAIACGRPVVATDLPGNRELVHAGENGFLVPRADSPALTVALDRVIADATLRRRMGAAGRALAECYGWAGVADRYLALSEAIVAARRPHSAASKQVAL
jgi:glycosyltransferase involved in cell wall biosynthesis